MPAANGINGGDASKKRKNEATTDEKVNKKAATDVNGSTECFIGQYILDRLKQLGVTHMFGLPGDFNLTFLDLVEDDPDITWVGCANELNAAYAAEGFARVTKGIGCLLTTFGVGDLSAINGIANSYSERVGIVHLVGSPNSRALAKSKEVIHHTLGDGRADVFLNVAKNLTVAQTRLDIFHLDKSASEIDRVMTECVHRRKPVYIDIPTDVVYASISNSPLNKPLTLESIRQSLADPGENDKLLDHVVKRIIHILNAAQRPIIIVDMCAVRHNIVPLVLQLIEETQLPFITTPMAKAALPEDHPLFRGVYCGKVSNPEVYDLIQTCDLALSVGRMRADMNTGAFSYILDPELEIELHSTNVTVQFARYDEINFFNLLPRLIEALKPLKFNKPLALIPNAGLVSFDKKLVQKDRALTQGQMWPMIASIFREGDVLISEVGSCSFGLLNVKLPPVKFESATIWASIGFAGGCILGAAVAAKQLNERAFLLTGEGSWMETIQDLGTVIRNGLKPIIFLINNSGYTVERLIHGPHRKYNEVAQWNWQLALQFMGAAPDESATYRIETEGQLYDLLHSAAFQDTNKIQLVELITDKLDSPPALVKHMELAAKSR